MPVPKDVKMVLAGPLKVTVRDVASKPVGGVKVGLFEPPFVEALSPHDWDVKNGLAPRWCGHLLQPQDYGCDSYDSTIISGGLFEAGCDAAELLEF
jgi:hypothetical protein